MRYLILLLLVPSAAFATFLYTDAGSTDEVGNSSNLHDPLNGVLETDLCSLTLDASTGWHLTYSASGKHSVALDMTSPYSGNQGTPEAPEAYLYLGGTWSFDNLSGVGHVWTPDLTMKGSRTFNAELDVFTDESGYQWEQNWFTFRFNFAGDPPDTAPVPEPASLGLLAMGGIFARKMREKNQT